MPIDVTVSGIVTEVKVEHTRNAFVPIDVTVLGISTEVNPIQLSNTLLPTFVTPSGHTNYVAFLTASLVLAG